MVVILLASKGSVDEGVVDIFLGSADADSYKHAAITFQFCRRTLKKADRNLTLRWTHGLIVQPDSEMVRCDVSDHDGRCAWALNHWKSKTAT